MLAEFVQTVARRLRFEVNASADLAEEGIFLYLLEELEADDLFTLARR